MAGLGADGADRSPSARAVRWLLTVPVTGIVCSLLVFVYAVELALVLTAGPRVVTWWFVATPTPSPGWVLGPLAHTPANPAHLVGNVMLLGVFGGMAERRLGPRAYLAALAVAAAGGTAGQLAWYAVTGQTGATLGASAMALAATAYASTASLLSRVATGQWAGETTPVWAGLGLAVVAHRLVLDLGVVVPGIGRFGHLWGILFGAALALSRASRVSVETGE